MTHKSLSEIKDEVARKHYYDSWESLCKLGNHDGTPDKWIDEAIEHHALQFQKEIERLKGKTNYDEVEVLTKEIERLKGENEELKNYIQILG